MLHLETRKLVEEVFGFFDTHGFSSGSAREELAKNDPEACIISLLQSIKDRLPCVSAMLYSTVQMAASKIDVEEARKLLGHLSTTPSRKVKTRRRKTPKVRARRREKVTA